MHLPKMPSSRCGDGNEGDEPIAIVGMAARLPGNVTDSSRFWDMISSGRNAYTEVPPARWNAEAWYHPDPDRRGTVRGSISSLASPPGYTGLTGQQTNVKLGCFLSEDVALFDAPFFSMTAQEAAGMDPMQRLLLEVTYECIENGISFLPAFFASRLPTAKHR